MGEDEERDARESSPQPGRRRRGSKVTGRRETGRKETGRKETGRKKMGEKTTRAKEMGVGERGEETGVKETSVNAMGQGNSDHNQIYFDINIKSESRNKKVQEKHPQR